MRNVPILTFKLDRDARDHFDLLDEIDQSPALDQLAGEVKARGERRRRSSASGASRSLRR
jgi:hypothetical protein